MNKERLLKLATHLEMGKLGHERFDFAQLNNSDGPTCGTLGCAIGECPIAFPESWYFDRYGEPLLIDQTADDAFCDASDFFDIDSRARDHLFSPCDQYTKVYGGIDLDGSATKEQVAANIRAFVAKMENDAKEFADA